MDAVLPDFDTLEAMAAGGSPLEKAAAEVAVHALKGEVPAFVFDQFAKGHFCGAALDLLKNLRGGNPTRKNVARALVDYAVLLGHYEAELGLRAGMILEDEDE